MTRKVTVRRHPRLMGAKEVAEAAGCRVNNLGKQAGLPAPIASLSCGRIWLAEDVEEWVENRRRT